MSLKKRSTAGQRPSASRIVIHAGFVSTSRCVPRRSCSIMSRTIFCRLPSTCSIVSAVRLMEKLHSITTTEPSTRVHSTSMPVRGPKRISRSCGYCESQLISAPRLTIPCCTSITMPAPWPPEAYPMATNRSVVVDMNACSTPPRTLNLLGVQNSSGSFIPAMPR